MANDLPEMPSIPLGRHRHHQGGEHPVVGVARRSESLEPLAVHRPLSQDSGDWARPFIMFLETVEDGSQAPPRLSPAAADSSPAETDIGARVRRLQAAAGSETSP